VNLQPLINELREYAQSSFTPSGAVAGAHSYPGPEPGKVGMSGGPVFPIKTDTPEKVLQKPGHWREKIRKVRKWRKGHR